MSSFRSNIVLVPLAVFASGTQNIARQLKTVAEKHVSAVAPHGVALEARRIGCDLPDATVIRLTPSQIRILD